jgi:hypothetical protein
MRNSCAEMFNGKIFYVSWQQMSHSYLLYKFDSHIQHRACYWTQGSWVQTRPRAMRFFKEDKDRRTSSLEGKLTRRNILKRVKDHLRYDRDTGKQHSAAFSRPVFFPLR